MYDGLDFVQNRQAYCIKKDEVSILTKPLVNFDPSISLTPHPILRSMETLSKLQKKNASIRKCKRCKNILEIERDLDYPYFCPNCDENMFSFESYIEDLKT